MHSHTIRTQFLEYFQQRGHQLVPSFPLVPRDDPTLLLVNAGMVPFKPFFLGLREPPANRLTTCQKAFRTVDIDEVGSSAVHDTFFEMLGNFSFGAYFKAETIEFAFEFLTSTVGLSPERLYPSVHPADSDSLGLWERVAGFPESRITKLADNYWQAGPTGPCGVDSEIYYDLGPEFGFGPKERPGTGSRFLEIWNLVFMDSERFADGTTKPLDRPGVDTGLGLERLAMVLQGVPSIFDTDLFAPILMDFQARSRATTVTATERLRHLRILADHTRGACALIGDDVRPSNEGRGYVLRRILRRALVSAFSLEVEGGLIPAAEVAVQILGVQYPEMRAGLPAIKEILSQESSRFQETLDRGMGQFQTLADGASSGKISGADAFRLHDTFGFPFELTQDLAQARGLQVDEPAFQELLEAQRDRARTSRTTAPSGDGNDARAHPAVDPGPLPTTRFRGYEEVELETEVLFVQSNGTAVARAEEGPEVQVVLADNPFYAEGGGQVGDRGALAWAGGAALVLDSQPSEQGASLQLVRVLRGELAVGQRVLARVDPTYRRGTAAHHSATHLLNRALREVLGEGVVQRGSYVATDHATFDFSWPEAISAEQLTEVERCVNRALRHDLPRLVELLSVDEARRSGAVALPEETYGEVVRVVSFGDFSKELCGGTHVTRTGEIGAAILTGSRSVGQGLRRIELVAGEAAERWWEAQRTHLADLSAAVQSPAPEILVRVRALQDRVREMERELRRGRQLGAAGAGGSVAVEQVAGSPLATEDLGPELDRRELRQHGDTLLERAPGGAAVVVAGGQLLIRLSEAQVSRGLSAGTMAETVCRELGGRGGGTQELGQGRIPEAGHQAALTAVRTILGSALEEG